MAATWRAVFSGGGTTGTSDRTVVFTPTANDLLIVFCNASVNSNSAPTCSDNNSDGLGTYTLLAAAQRTTGGPDWMSAFVRNGLVGSGTSTTITLATGSNSAAEIVIVAVAGASVAGVAAIRQVGEQELGGAGTTPAPAFAGGANTNNLTIGAVGNATVAGSVVVQPSGWTERADVSQGSPTTGLEVATRDSGFADSTITWGGTSATDFASIIVEVSSGVAESPAPSKLAAILGLLLLSWQPLTPAPPARVEIAPTIVQAQADAPPPLDRRALNRIVGQWWKPILHGTGGSAAPVVADDPPFDGRRVDFAPIYQAWKWRPVGSGSSAAVVADAPPGARSSLPVILAHWQAPPLLAQRGPRAVATLPGASVDPPPPTGRTGALATIVTSWRPAPAGPQVGAHAPIPMAAPDDPPFDSRRARLSPIYQAWKWRPVGSGTAAAPPADNPPFGFRGPIGQITAAAWQPPLIIAIWSGVLSPDSVDDPPIGRRELTPIVQAWSQTGGPVPRARQLVQGAAPDNPPFGFRPAARLIAQAWLQGSGPVPRARVLSPDSVDDPPVGRRDPTAFAQAWTQTDGLVQRARQVVQGAAAPDNPPFSVQPTVGLIAQAWQPAVGGVALPRPRTFIPGSSVEAPPPTGTAEMLATVGLAWVPAPPPPPRAGPLSPGIPGQSVDSPPLRGPATGAIQATWVRADALPPRAPQLVQGVSSAISDPPFDTRRAAWGPIYQAWRWRPVGSGDGAPVVVVVDDPPFAAARLRPEVLAAWATPPPLPQRARPIAGLPGTSVDPPPTTGTTNVLAIIQVAWLPVPPPPPQRGLLSPGIPGQSVDPPPPIAAPALIAQAAWQATVGLPQRAPQLVQGVTPQADTPPFGVRPIGVHAAWAPAGALLPPRAPQLAQGTPADTPPVGHRDLASVLQAWLQAGGGGLPPRGPQLVQAPADTPPVGHRDLAAVLAAWQPGPSLPQRASQLEQGAPPPPVDNPPFGGGRPTVEQITAAAWQPPAWLSAPRRAVLVPSSVAPIPLVITGPFTVQRAGGGPVSGQRAGAGILSGQRAGGGPISGQPAGGGPITEDA